MSLSDRLAEAAQARRGNPEAQERRLEPVPDGAESVEMGLPAPCPQCGGRGFLDQIDLVRRRQHEHCKSCSAKWSRPI